MKRNLILLIVLLSAGQLFAQNFQKTAQGAKGVVQGLDIQIEFYTPATVRIVKTPQGKSDEKKSLSVIKTPVGAKNVLPLPVAVSESEDVLTLESSALTLELNKKNGAIGFYNKTGEYLLLNKENGTQFTPFDDAGTPTYTVKETFLLGKDEAIYGLGQHQNGKLNQRNTNYYMVQSNVEDVIPFFQSIKGYGLFWDNYSPTVFNDSDEETSFRSEVGDCSDYYFMYGGSADGVIAQMRELTGQAPMFPLWTYGFWQSRERYKSQNEIVKVVNKYRELGVPLDGIIQDWQYWGGNYLWNAMEFLNPEFYNPQQMTDDIHQQNAHLIISIWSSFGPHTKPYKELDEKNMLFDFKTWPLSGPDTWPPNPEYPSGVRVYDAYNPAARDIYWKYVNQGLFSVGIDGWWMDSTEPDHLEFQPSDMDTKTYLGSFRKVRNAYPLMSVGGVYDHQRAVESEKRVFILTRSAFAGQQRYGANTWSGDVQASWEDLARQIPAGLNFSLCGIPYWNSDIGGFFLGKYPDKLDDPDYRELYVRWLQFGTFCPMMRSHGADAPREIYQFGKKGEPVYNAIEKFIRLRYNLLPYIYSASWDVSAHSSSMMRALAMDFAGDKKVWNINDGYLFGKSLLVYPVTQPAKSKEVYLPEGADWYDFWTNEKLAGGRTLNKETPLNIIPLYVKAGTVIPWGHNVQYATEKNWDNLEIRIYPGADGTFTLYEDENDNYNYEKGAFSTITFKWNDRKRILTVNNRIGDFTGMLGTRKFIFTLPDGTKKTVDYNGKQLNIKL